jgi:hypothetical protein
MPKNDPDALKKIIITTPPVIPPHGLNGIRMTFEQFLRGRIYRGRNPPEQFHPSTLESFKTWYLHSTKLEKVIPSYGKRPPIPDRPAYKPAAGTEPADLSVKPSGSNDLYQATDEKMGLNACRKCGGFVLNSGVPPYEVIIQCNCP